MRSSKNFAKDNMLRVENQYNQMIDFVRNNIQCSIACFLSRGCTVADQTAFPKLDGSVYIGVGDWILRRFHVYDDAYSPMN